MKAPARGSRNILCMVRFETNRKANFDSVVKLCRRAHYSEKNGAHSAVFSRDQIKIAAAVLEEMHAFSWKFVLVANDRIQKRKQNLASVFECYCVASRLKKPNAHCHRTIDNPFDPDRERGVRITIGEDESVTEKRVEKWLLPCKKLSGSVSATEHPQGEAASTLLEAAALDLNVNLCPLFNAQAFGPLPRRIGDKPPQTFW